MDKPKSQTPSTDYLRTVYKAQQEFSVNANIFQSIANTLSTQYAQKNTHYGDSFGKSIEKYGAIAFLTRASDKFNRMEQLILSGKDGASTDERLYDTLGDLASYCIMMMMTMEDNKNDE